VNAAQAAMETDRAPWQDGAAQRGDKTWQSSLDDTEHRKLLKYILSKQQQLPATTDPRQDQL